MPAKSSPSSSWHSRSRCWQRSTQAGARRGSIRWRRCAMSDALRLTNVTRTYPQGQGILEVFRGLDASLKQGEAVALVGPSSAGKSSLLHIAGLLEAPTSGEVYILGASASSLPDAERTRIRRDTIGFVYQAH